MKSTPFDFLALKNATILVEIALDVFDAVPATVRLAGPGSPMGKVECRLGPDKVLAAFRGDDVLRWAHKAGVLAP